MMPPDPTRPRILRKIIRCEDILPAPFVRRVGILDRQRPRHLYLVHVLFLVRQILRLPPLEPRPHFLAILGRERHIPILISFAPAHDQSALVKIHVLDAQPQQFVDPHSRPVQQRPHKVFPPDQPFHHRLDLRLDLRPARHHRQPQPPSRPLKIRKIPNIFLQRCLEQKNHRVQRLILSGCGHLPVFRQVLQKRADVPRLHRRWLLPVVKAHELPNPPHIRLLRSVRIMRHPQTLFHLRLQ